MSIWLDLFDYEEHHCYIPHPSMFTECTITYKNQNIAYHELNYLPLGSDCATLDVSIFFSDFCHLTLWNNSEGLPPLEKPSVGAMEPLFVSGRMLPLLWLDKNVGISIMSSICVLLSHRKLHDGECLTFL